VEVEVVVVEVQGRKVLLVWVVLEEGVVLLQVNGLVHQILDLQKQ
jgi:hypothetical protein